jgi:hypothetical protein
VLYISERPSGLAGGGRLRIGAVGTGWRLLAVAWLVVLGAWMVASQPVIAAGEGSDPGDLPYPAWTPEQEVPAAATAPVVQAVLISGYDSDLWKETSSSVSIWGYTQTKYLVDEVYVRVGLWKWNSVASRWDLLTSRRKVAYGTDFVSVSEVVGGLEAGIYTVTSTHYAAFLGAEEYCYDNTNGSVVLP